MFFLPSKPRLRGHKPAGLTNGSFLAETAGTSASSLDEEGLVPSQYYTVRTPSRSMITNDYNVTDVPATHTLVLAYIILGKREYVLYPALFPGNRVLFRTDPDALRVSLSA